LWEGCWNYTSPTVKLYVWEVYKLSELGGGLVDDFGCCLPWTAKVTFLDQLSGRYGDTYLSELDYVVEHFAPEAYRFLEWGSGESTKLFCAKASTRANCFILSIDDNKEYIRSVSTSLPSYPFLHFRHVDLQGPSLNQQDQLPSYSSYPLFLNLEFDVIFIDGRRRAECALTASQVLTETGVVILHDWRRSRYAAIRSLFETVCEGEQFLVLRLAKGSKRSDRAMDTSNKNHAIIVPIRGSRAEREAKITLPWTQAYAKRVGADCVTVGQSSHLPDSRLKYEALKVAQDFDRILLLDADIIIRPEAPDVFKLVPADHLGAFPEGMFFPRAGWCEELSALYRLDRKLQPHEYFNSGVLVLSKANYALLKSLKDDRIFGHPQFEQGHLNVQRAVLNVPLFPLPPDMNYIPDAAALPLDWRYGFFIHPAALGKPQYLHDTLWEDLTGTRKTFSKRQFVATDVRAFLLEAYSDQLQGRDVIYLDATDFSYPGAHGFPVLDVSGEIIAHFPAEPDSSGAMSMYGPHVTLPAGTWAAEFVGMKWENKRERAALVEVTREDGTQHILPLQQWPENDRLEFKVDRQAERVEFRLYRTSPSAFEFSLLRLERKKDDLGGVG
jgi:hypothetical protein